MRPKDSFLFTSSSASLLVVAKVKMHRWMHAFLSHHRDALDNMRFRKSATHSLCHMAIPCHPTMGNSWECRYFIPGNYHALRI